MYSEILPNFELFFENSPSTETLDYVLLDGFMSDLLEFTICFWMQTEDKDNYGTPFSYATKHEDNEVITTNQYDISILIVFTVLP